MWWIILLQQMLKSMIFINWESLLLYFLMLWIIFPCGFTPAPSLTLMKSFPLSVWPWLWLALTNRMLAKTMHAEAFCVLVQLDLAFAHRWLAMWKGCPGPLLALDSGAQYKCTWSRSEPNPEPEAMLDFICILKRIHPAEVQRGSAK